MTEAAKAEPFSKQQFIDFVIHQGALAFGEYRLKSGRTSPYFFNTGVFNKGTYLYKLACFYAAAINASGIEYDQIFGPAYKGIPLACAIVIALDREFKQQVPFCSSRKEEKTHGDAGLFLGAAPAGRVLIVDDVLTAGTSIRGSIDILRQAGATPVSALVALDRCEHGLNMEPAAHDIKAAGLEFMSIIDLHDILEWLSRDHSHATEHSALHAHIKSL
ncbi:MAG: orotate phosphoribosyltransferase [Candidatus Porifericomitaceae bacterium WSBS_2022_MAG_OTU9]